MKPLEIKPKEVDIVVSSLEQSLLYWSEFINNRSFTKEFSQELVEGLFEDILSTYDKFCLLQIQMDEDLELQQNPLPENVLKFPRS